MAKPLEIAYAYCAGLIDGEGCISIGKRKTVRHNNVGTNQMTEIPRQDEIVTYYTLFVIVVTKDNYLTDYLKGIFGGSVNDVARTTGFAPGIYKRWVVAGNIALSALKKMLPYLILKRLQAETAIQFQNELHRDLKKGRGFKLSNKSQEERNKYYLRMRELKKCAGAETNSLDTSTEVKL